MSALISHFTDYVRKIWIKYRKIVTSECLSVQVQSCEKASIIGQYSTIRCTVQWCTVQYPAYCTLVARNRPDCLQFERVIVHVFCVLVFWLSKTIHLDFNGQNMFSDLGKVVQCVFHELLMYFHF